jgi:uncharacterized protein YerC
MDVLSYIQAAAEVKASEIVKKFPSRKADWEDFKQDLMIHAWQQFEKHNPKRGTMKTFISAVVRNQGMTILRNLAKNRVDVCEIGEIAGKQRPDAIMDNIPQEYWQVAQMIAKGYTRAEIEKKTGVSQWKIRKKVLPAIKRSMGY